MRLLALVVLAALVVDVPAEHPITKRVLFLVDTSGSMTGDSFEKALGVVRQVMTQPVDEAEFAVVAFTDHAVRWRPNEAGWVPAADPKSVEAAAAWLRERGAGGDTLAVPGLKLALAEDRDEMTVVLVSDGLFGREAIEEILAATEEAQSKRKHRAVIAVVTVGFRQPVLERLARAGRGGCYREE